MITDQKIHCSSCFIQFRYRDLVLPTILTSKLILDPEFLYSNEQLLKKYIPNAIMSTRFFFLLLEKKDKVLLAVYRTPTIC